VCEMNDVECVEWRGAVNKQQQKANADDYRILRILNRFS
jgi:hypothetical protein